RGALRWSLSKIRQIVSDGDHEHLASDRNSVMLRSDAITLDLRRLRATARHDLANVDVAELERAAALFRGGFLEDLPLPRCPEYEAWRTSHINELDLLKARILRTLVDRLADAPARALPHAHALSVMQPADEAIAATVRALADRARADAVAGAPITAVPSATAP